MKKFMILAAGTMMITSAAFAQIGIAPEVGVNFANMHGRYTDPSSASKDDITFKGGTKIGVKVGANVNINVGDRIQIQPGLFYSIKGFKQGSPQNRDNGYYLAPTKENMTVHYAELPVNVQYMFNDPGEGRFFIGLGGYVAMAFSGKDKLKADAVSVTTGGVTVEQPATDVTNDLKFGNDAPSNDLRRFNAGAQANAGYQLRSGIFFRAMYQYGITNLLPQGNRSTGDASLHDSNITASIGYVFGYHK